MILPYHFIFSQITVVDGTAASQRHRWKSNNSSYWCGLEKDTLWGPSTPDFTPSLPGAMKFSTLKEAYWLSLEFNSHGILKLEGMRRPVVFHLVLLLLFYFYSSIKYYHTESTCFCFLSIFLHKRFQEGISWIHGSQFENSCPDFIQQKIEA